MLHRLKNRRVAGEGGFTLIELLVVIIILGILAAVVVFAVGGINDKGQTSACRIDTRTLRTAEEAYSGSPVGAGSYTENEQVLVDAGFLSQQSELHNIELLDDADPKKGFNILVADARCGTPGGVAGQGTNL